MKQAAIHPKLYATVLSREHVWFVARTDAGEDLAVQVAYKSGGGSHADVQVGVRVKLYRRPTEEFFRYRLLGR